MIFYTGRRRYQSPLSLKDLVDAPKSLLEAHWGQPIHLVDVQNVEDACIREQIHLGVLLLTFKHDWESAEPELRRLFRQFSLIESEERARFLLAAIVYIISTSEVKSEELCQAAEAEIDRQAGGWIMTTAERLRREGLKEGLREGLKEGIAIGEKRGIIIGELQSLKRLYKAGILTSAQHDAMAAPLLERLEDEKDEADQP